MTIELLKTAMPYAMVASSLLYLANGIWAFRDARSRGRSGVLISLLVLGTFPLGVALWLVARPRRLEEIDPASGEESPEPDDSPDANALDPDAALKERANAGLL
jgi:hypothetical protein